MEALAASLHIGHGVDPLIRSAMAHLNLVMIHPSLRDPYPWMRPTLAEPADAS